MNIDDLIKKYEGCETVFVMAGGPSLVKLNYQSIDPKLQPVITCNTAFRLKPNATISHHTDYSWWNNFKEELLRDFKGSLISGNGLGYSHSEYPEPVHFFKYTQERKFDPKHIEIFGANSGLQGLIIAHYFAPKNIVLMGYDHRPANNGQTHWENAQPLLTQEKMQDSWNKSLKNFTELAQKRSMMWDKYRPEVPLPRIFNASPESLIEDFEKIDSIDQFILK